MTFTTTPIAFSVHQANDDPIFGDSVTRVSLDDEGGGQFLVLEQEGAKIKVELDELRLILEAAEKLMVWWRRA